MAQADVKFITDIPSKGKLLSLSNCFAGLYFEMSRRIWLFRDEMMSNQPRVARVLVALLVSMTGGAVVLMTLGSNTPSAGPYSLSSYPRLDRLEKAIGSRSAQSPERWKGIELYLSGTEAGNIRQLASLSGLASPDDINCHFVICNGLGGRDGQIQTTEKWQRQWFVITGKNRHPNGRIIRICIVANGKNVRPTDSQIKTAKALVNRLSEKFDIRSESIYHPSDWPSQGG